VKVFLGLLFLVGVGAARADLYRWVDPQSGAIKFSNVPPPASQAGVEVVPYSGSAAPPKPAPPPGTAAAPVDPALDLRWRELLGEISVAPPGSALLKQRLQDFIAAGAELDKRDPAGAERRRAEAQAVLQRLLGVEK
jgi:hypothetical protein